MKKLIPFLFSLFFIHYAICQAKQPSTDNFTRIQNAGIVAELIALKHASEGFAASIINDTTVSNPKKQACLTKYNRARMFTDQFLIQLISDLTIKNRPKIFKKLNQLFISHTMENI